MLFKKYKESCEVLSISLDQSLDNEKLKFTFRKLVVQHHPDKGGSEDKFKEINSAYEYIKKHQDDYEKFLTNPPDDTIDPSLFNVDEFIDNISTFSVNKRMKRRPTVDVKIDMELTLQEIHDSMKTMVMYTRRVSCQDCEGQGCQTCRNVGVMHQDVILEINITSDVMDKDGNLVYSTYGDLIKGLPMGNLIIKPIYPKGELFSLQLSDNDYPVVISECNVFEGDGGKKIRVDTLNGKVELTLPDKIKNNQVIRIKGKGLHFRHKEGDHHIILKFI